MGENQDKVSTELALQFLREGKTHECIECAEKVLTRDPDDAKAYSILGAAYTTAGERGKAMGAFQQALDLSPSARAHFNLGKVFEDSGRMGEALEQYSSAVQMDPNYQPAVQSYNRLAPPPPEPTPADPYAQPSSSGQQTMVGAPPSAGQPTPQRLPDLRALEARARENDEKARLARKKMTIAGLKYGIVCGPFCLMGVRLLLIVFGVHAIVHPVATLIEGIIFGGLVGLWIGFTCGDDSSGMKIGALLGIIAQTVPALSTGDPVYIAISAIMGALVGGAAGHFIGQMVEMSISG